VDTKQIKEKKITKNKLISEQEVYKKLKEIAKLEMPLDINKEIKKLKEQTDYNLQTLQKQLNYIRQKNKKEKIHNTNDTNDNYNTYDTNDTNTNIPAHVNNSLVSLVSLVSQQHAYLKVILGFSAVDEIIGVLMDSKRTLTVGEIALKTGKSESNIKNTIYKNKEIFDTYKPNGKIAHVFLLPMVFKKLHEKIDEIKKLEAQKEKAETELRLKEMQSKDFIMEVQNYLTAMKPQNKDGFIPIDFRDVVSYSPKLADIMLENPEGFIEQLYQHYPFDVNFKIINIPSSIQHNIENLRTEHLNTLFSIEGRVTSLGEVRPVIAETIYECPSCGTLIKYKQNYRIGIIKEPNLCTCGRKGGFKLQERKDINACFVQLEDLQERTDNPHSRRIKGVLFKNLCDYEVIKKFTPGNEVKCLGILKEVPIKKGNSKSVFLNWIFEIIDVELIEREIEVADFKEDELIRIKETCEKINNEGINILFNSFAPEVYGYEKIKGAMILQSCNKRNEPKIKSVRNKSNILMIGDPGIAKSVLGDFALKINTGSKKAVGGGSSAVGITASVVKEEDSLGGFRVEPGAMVLARDLLFIDELNNLQEEDKPKLQEGMSEQKISINKANLHVQMKVTCGIIAAANPIYGAFKQEDKLTWQEQFNIPTPILNRFDSIFVMKDEINEDYDRNVAKKMINRQRKKLNAEYDIEFLRKFFVYVRNLPDPEIDDELQEILLNVYSLARKTSNQGVKINPRFLESLTRMAISSAKLRNDSKVTLKDVQTAIYILSGSQYRISELTILEQIKIESKGGDI